MSYNFLVIKCNLNLPDGYGLKIFSGITHIVPGVEFMLALCRLAMEKGWTVGMLGNPNTKLAAKELYRLFPKLKITFAYDNPEADRLIEDYDALRYVDIFFLGLGHPSQEKFLWNCKLNIAHCPFRVGMGVGGSFDFISGQV
ncbi:WecB/TagA/CpsF family glycosyltransferase, partial [Candidatus Gottesmanbacteria bacterium]|nr:WecB/TagA/CpsF family glycosyltransferase [Candidatus Gottesmanbacteria bacterium]